MRESERERVLWLGLRIALYQIDFDPFLFFSPVKKQVVPLWLDLQATSTEGTRIVGPLFIQTNCLLLGRDMELTLKSMTQTPKNQRGLELWTTHLIHEDHDPCPILWR